MSEPARACRCPATDCILHTNTENPCAVVRVQTKSSAGLRLAATCKPLRARPGYALGRLGRSAPSSTAVQACTRRPNPAPAPNARAPAAQKTRAPRLRMLAAFGTRARPAPHARQRTRLATLHAWVGRLGWCVVLLKRHSSIVRRPGRTCKHVRCSRLPPHYFRGSIGPTRHCPRSIPGAKSASNLPEQGLTLLTQPKL